MFLRLSALMLPGVVLSGCIHPRSVEAPPVFGAFASVARDSALLVFPSDPGQTEWPINLDPENAGAEDYHWIVTIPHAPSTQLVWFTVNQVKDQTRAIASLQQFVARAHAIAGRAAGGPYVWMLDSTRLGVTAVRGRPAIVVRGRSSVAELFDQRPGMVTFVRHTRGQQSLFDSVAVVYR